MTYLIVGYGRFGKLLSEILGKESCKILDPKLGYRVSDDDMKSASYVFLCVPTRNLEGVCKSIILKVSKDAFIVSMCSVMAYPKRILSWYFGKNRVMIMHPLFGPQSYDPNSINWCVYDNKFRDNYFIRNVLVDKGIMFNSMTSRQHDKIIGGYHFISHLLSYVLRDFHLARNKNEDDTPCPSSVKLMLQLRGITNNESSQLLEDMLKYNTYAIKSINLFKRSINSSINKIKFSASS